MFMSRFQTRRKRVTTHRVTNATRRDALIAGDEVRGYGLTLDEVASVHDAAPLSEFNDEWSSRAEPTRHDPPAKVARQDGS